MEIKSISIEEGLDPVFARFGQRVYTYDYVEKLRGENVKLKTTGQKVYNLIPQKGLQEDVTMIDADFIIAGSVRGVGKTWLALFIALSYINNPQSALYGFRKLEDDIKRSLWESSKHVFTGFGTPTESSYEWKFPSGAKFKMEQLYNARTVRERFRGAEQPYMMVEELQEHTVENMDLIFTLIGSNRNTVGLKNRFVATCNPVGKSNSLRQFLDWYIDPDTDTVIPERDGKKRYFFRFGTKADEIAWGDTKEEVYDNINARKKIERVCSKTGDNPLSLISSLVFIQGSFKDNKILQVSDKQYISKLMAQGDETSEKDVLGVWRDMDVDMGNLVSIKRIVNMFEAPSYNTNGFKRASADVALEGDFLVLMAFDGWHMVDVFAKSGIQSDTVVPIIKDFLKRNGVREDHFTYDSNGLGLWLKGHFQNAKQFNNKARSAEPEIYANLKTECAYKWAMNAKDGKYTIEPTLANMKFVKKGGVRFSLRDILIDESKVVRMRGEDANRYEIIQKTDMKKIIGHSPDFIECFFMIENIDMTKRVFSRNGFGAW